MPIETAKQLRVGMNAEKRAIDSFEFGSRRIGKDQPVFIIAECGINHGGSYGEAEAMIRAAAKCRADAVKFQTYRTEKRVPGNSPIFDLLKRCELGEAAHRKLKEVADSLGILFFSTPFDTESVTLLEEIDVPGYKIASFDIVNYALLRAVCGAGKPVICSTGMADGGEVDRAQRQFAQNGIPYALLHCVSAYPTKPEDANLKVIQTLKSIYAGPVGYSDHTLGVKVPVMAVAAGAQLIEKHFTLDKNGEGPDHRLSADPKEMKRMVRQIKEVEAILGDYRLATIEAERQTLVFRRPSQ